MTEPVQKLCPVVLRPGSHGLEVLVFRHPLAGVQLVKGTREAGESVDAGALRELGEESGIAQATVVRDLGSSLSIAPDQLWHFLLVETGPRPAHWVHAAADDGGHLFAFFWWRLADEPGPDWHESFRRALHHIRAALD